MKGMQLHFGFIRDKQAIHAALLQSKTLGRQLAICYASEGKLIVKVGNIMDLTRGKEGERVILRSKSEQPDSEFSILLDHIQSVYPIREFGQRRPEASAEMDYTADEADT